MSFLVWGFSVDARIELDDFAAPRQDRANLSSGVQVHPSELEAAKSGLFYIKPPVTPTQPRGNIGCFGYGAGLAMATMDAVVDAGGAVRSLPPLMPFPILGNYQLTMSVLNSVF